MKKDSFGNALPQRVLLTIYATSDQLGHALKVNSFILASCVALEKGKTVIYDANTKSATISEPNGMTAFISHK